MRTFYYIIHQCIHKYGFLFKHCAIKCKYTYEENMFTGTVWKKTITDKMEILISLNIYKIVCILYCLLCREHPDIILYTEAYLCLGAGLEWALGRSLRWGGWARGKEIVPLTFFFAQRIYFVGPFTFGGILKLFAPIVKKCLDPPLLYNVLTYIHMYMQTLYCPEGTI